MAAQPAAMYINAVRMGILTGSLWGFMLLYKKPQVVIRGTTSFYFFIFLHAHVGFIFKPWSLLHYLCLSRIKKQNQTKVL